ncbi:MAG: hypothetical protein H0U85_01265 [Gemmatimonadales bacterium]|nr:hypothetical protein [Gemmatimonadales bacterium]
MKRSLLAAGILLTCLFSAPAGAQGNSQAKPKITSVTLTPQMAAMLPSQCVRFTAVALDNKGKPVPGATFTWNFGNAPWFTAGQPGEVCVPSSFQGAGNASLSVNADGSTAAAYGTLLAVEVPATSYTSPTLNPGGCMASAISAKDGSGATISNPPITWIVGGAQAANFKVTYTDVLKVCAVSPLAVHSFATMTYLVTSTGEAKSMMLEAAP